MTNPQTTNEVIEHIGGDFGVTVIYGLDDTSRSHVDVFVVEIVARGEANEPLYERRDSVVSCDHVTDPHQAEPYFSGAVKWDGCSHMNFGHDGYLHLCGSERIQKLGATLKTIYERCGELMFDRGVSLLNNEFIISMKVKS